MHTSTSHAVLIYSCLHRLAIHLHSTFEMMLIVWLYSGSSGVSVYTSLGSLWRSNSNGGSSTVFPWLGRQSWSGYVSGHSSVLCKKQGIYVRLNLQHLNSIACKRTRTQGACMAMQHLHSFFDHLLSYIASYINSITMTARIYLLHQITYVVWHLRT